MSSGSPTVFKSSASGSAATDFLKDAFTDISLLPDTNGALTDTASTNPTGTKLFNADIPLFSAKTFWFKDLQFIEDSTKWINNQPTYTIVTDEEFPAVKLYAYGTVDCASRNRQSGLALSRFFSGIGVTGKIRRIIWIVAPDTNATAVLNTITDGAAVSTISVNSYAAGLPTIKNKQYAYLRYLPHQASNETNDLHDFRIQQQSTAVAQIFVYGCVVYFENTGANIEVLPGSTYINKQKITTAAAASLSVPAFGSSLGGKASIFKTTTSEYGVSTYSVPFNISAAQGSSGTNIISVSTGHGSSFPVGTAVVVPQTGTSHYFGVVQNVSTDSLTVNPTLSFGISNIIYTAWNSTPTLPIGSTIMVKTDRISAFDYNILLSATQIFNYQPSERYTVQSAIMGTTASIDGTKAFTFTGVTTTAFFKLEGYFQAADIELTNLWTGASTPTFAATFSVDGLPAFSMSEGITGTIKRTIVSNAGPGWHQILIKPASGNNAFAGIKAINLYTQQNPPGISFGLLGSYLQNQAPVYRPAYNATLLPLGIARRVPAMALDYEGLWTFADSPQAPAPLQAQGSSTTALMKWTYYGKDFSVIGTAGGGTLQVDGVGVPLLFNAVQTVASEGFHTVQYNCGTTAIINAFDYFASKSEVEIEPKLELKTNYNAPKDRKVRASYYQLAATAQVINAGTAEGIVWDAKIYDTHNIVNSAVSNAYIKVPRSGMYYIRAVITCQATNFIYSDGPVTMYVTDDQETLASSVLALYQNVPGNGVGNLQQSFGGGNVVYLSKDKAYMTSLIDLSASGMALLGGFDSVYFTLTEIGEYEEAIPE